MKQGWFTTPGRPGDRTLDEQLLGLELIDWKGKQVLDLGCAEGLICEHALRHGAECVHGVEIVADHVWVAQKRKMGAHITAADLNRFDPPRGFDIVLMLAILHKLAKPLDRLAVFAECCDDLAVIRLPPKTGPVIVDSRSGNVAFDTRPVMREAGFRLEAEHYKGPRGEYMAYWRRA